MQSANESPALARVKALSNEQRRGISIAAINKAKGIHAARLELAAALLKVHGPAIAKR